MLVLLTVKLVQYEKNWPMKKRKKKKSKKNNAVLYYKMHSLSLLLVKIAVNGQPLLCVQPKFLIITVIH